MDFMTALLFGAVVLLSWLIWQLFRARREQFIQSRVIAATGSSVLVTDATVPRHPIIAVNPAFRLLTGYSDDDVIGQSTQLLHGHHTDRSAIEKIGLALQDGRACRVTVRHYRKNGTPFWNDVTVSPVKNRAGHVTQHIWVMNDATQRQQAEDALKSSHDPSYLLAEVMTEAIMVISEANTVSYINPAGLRLLGAGSSEQLIGKPLATVVHPDRQDAAHQRIQYLRGSGEPHTRYEERFLRLDGPPHQDALTAIVSASPILWQGKASTLLSFSDPTAQQQARSMAQRLEQQLSSTETVAHLGSWEWKPLENRARWSNELYRILGYPPDTTTPSHALFLSSCHPEDRDRLDSALAEFLRSGTPLDIGYRVIHQNGAVRYVRCAGEGALKDDAGHTIQVSGTLQDLTPHVMMEQIAHDREEQFRMVVESAPNGILLSSEDGTITLANATLERMFGYGQGELTGRSVDMLVPEALRSNHTDQRRSFFASPHARPMGAGREFLAKRKDGTDIPVEIGLTPLRTSTGLQVLATIVDISARKALDALLGEKDALNQAVLDSLTAEVAVLDHAGDITTVNKAWRQFAPTAAGEATPISPGQNYLTICRNAVLQGDVRAQEALEGIDAVRTGTRDRFSMEYACPATDQPRWFAMTVMPLRGPREGLVITHEDISSRKRAEHEREQLLVQTQHLQKMEAIGTLAGGIAHEFNNSLTAVLGFSELALKGLPKDHKVRRHLDQVIVAGRKSRDLVHQLLTFSQQGRHLKRPLSLHVLVKESLKLLRPLVPSWIQMHEHILVPSPPVSADSSQMHQLLLNLVENALRAMQRTGGTLSIFLEEAHIKEPRLGPQARLEPGAYLRLIVRDTGAGMTPEVQSRIFDPFFTTKELGEGLGMGLAVVHGIVSAHGGAVFIDSTPDVGTTVEVYLPILPTPATGATPSGSEEPLPQGHECVLFVDDEESLARFGGEMLESLGYYAVVRMSASEALQAFRMAPQRFDLLITDRTMPNMGGDALARECRLLRPDLPIILCSGSEQRLPSETPQTQGTTKYVLKPLMLQDLARTIRQMLDQAASETPSSHQRYRELARELVEEHDAISPSR